MSSDKCSRTGIFRRLLAFLVIAVGPGGQAIFAQQESQLAQQAEMLRMAAISVTIGGDFPANGSFAASRQERVDQFVTRIYTLLQEQKTRELMALRQKEGTKVEVTPLKDFPRRNILLRHASGKTDTLDLERFRLTGDFKDNPYLQPDDVLVFPIVDKDLDFVSISGAVKKLTRFQYVSGDRLSTAILLSGGLNGAYGNITTATISRLDRTGDLEHIDTVSLQSDPLLRRGDRIFVLFEENERRDYRVIVDGEVYTPGSVPITKNATTLQEVIDRAGGFKPSADLNRAELIRGGNVFQSLFYSESFEQLLMSRTADITPEDSLVFIVDNRLRFLRGNGLIDFQHLDSAGNGDFVVRDGDYIFIPEKQELVYVFGQVRAPGYIEYHQAAGYDYYLAKAGGTVETARDQVYLIKGKSRDWKLLDDPNDREIEAGDFLWVPKKIPRDLNYYLLRIGAVAQIIGTIATVIILAKQF
jgi:protein involved in polysaccharide export with SLBB domain